MDNELVGMVERKNYLSIHIQQDPDKGPLVIDFGKEMITAQYEGKVIKFFRKEYDSEVGELYAEILEIAKDSFGIKILEGIGLEIYNRLNNLQRFEY